MRIRHKLLSGEVVITDLDELECDALDRLKQYAEKEDADYYKAYQRAFGGHLFLPFTVRDIQESKLYLIVRDIITRLGERQGLILEKRYEHLRSTIPQDGSNLDIQRAAHYLGISIIETRKLIEENKIESFRFGNLVLVGKKSLKEYREGRDK